MDTQVQEVLQKSTIDGVIVRLPEGQLDRKVYEQVAKALQGIGGKWKGGKVMGFVFPSDPTPLLEQVAGGEKINLKKEFQFFATPDALCDKLVSLANINENLSILEPSAGDGAIIKAINRVLPRKVIDCYEAMPTNRILLDKIPTARILGDDFLQASNSRKYERIIANPPFTKNQDIDHLYKMYDLLNDGGKVVCVTSTHWKERHSSGKKESEFRAWLHNKGAVVEDVDAGTFKGSGTMVATVIITIVK